MDPIENSYAMPPGIERLSEFYTREVLFLPRSGFVQQANGADASALRASAPLQGTTASAANCALGATPRVGE